jgi:hypothetical protein
MDFKKLVDTFYTAKQDWSLIKDEDKESLFFIFNRYMAKKYPKKAQFFNKRNVDKATAMDVWFMDMKNEKRTPFWFWPGPTKKKDPPIKDWQVIQEFWKLSVNDIYVLCDMFPAETKLEIKRLQNINEEIAK